VESALREGGDLLALGGAFDPSLQDGDVDKKIVAALDRISQAYRALLQEEAQGRSLSPIQARFLVHLLYHPGELGRVGRLAVEFGLSRTTVSDAVRTLESKGLVRREPWSRDARVASLKLTPAGEEAASGPTVPSMSPRRKSTRPLATIRAVSPASSHIRSNPGVRRPCGPGSLEDARQAVR
jgi:DNA-binding MarR family transcriptional regulator